MMGLSYNNTCEINQYLQYYSKFNNDLTTPMAAYLKLNESDAFFLESVEKGTAIGRYSMIGFDPLLKVQGYDDYMALIKEQAPTVMDGDPLQQLNLLYKNIKHHQTGGTPIKNGFFGHFTWEIIWQNRSG